jgi:hypothetical protein
MTEGADERDPPRLREEAGDAGRALRSADSSFDKDLVEGAAWQKLDRRRRRRAAMRWALAAGAMGIAIGASGLLSRWDRQGLARPEPVTASIPDKPAGPSPDVRPTPHPAPATPVRPSPTRAPGAIKEPATEVRCRGLSSAGKSGPAVDCFEELSRAETDLTADVALYEAARLSAEGLQDPKRALRLLDEHQRRFSGSALRGEVQWLRVQSLHRSGRMDEALQGSEALLATAVGRTLASDLHFLRGQIYQDARRDCARAINEFVALVGEPGARGDQAEFRRATCLEQLGRDADALAAYERYLQRPHAASAKSARERLERLRGEATRAGE